MKNKKRLSQLINVTSISLILIYSSLGNCKPMDPTKPPQVILENSKQTQPLDSSQRLTAIFLFPHTMFAIIDGQRVTQGQHVGEYVVSNIKKNEVELTDKQNKRIMLKLAPSVKSMTMNMKGSSS